MSIKIGFINENYNYNNLYNKNNILSLNSYDDSNIILINNQNNTIHDMFTVYKNRFYTGVSSNTYIFKDNNDELLKINNSNIIFNSDIIINKNIRINDKIISSNNTTIINSNLIVDLVSLDNSFKINTSNNSNLLSINNSSIQFNSDDFQIKTLDNKKTILGINISNINISNNIYLNNGVLYVNKISPVNDVIIIDNARYSTTSIDDLVALKTLSVRNNVNTDIDNVSFEIYKKTGNSNFVNIYSCNLNSANIPIFSINKNGFLGIGTTNPNSCITINKISDRIINYNGEVLGDTFQLNKRGNIGIGTTNPNGQLHIRRNDDLKQDDIRKLPMINIDMSYNTVNNISNSFIGYSTEITSNIRDSNKYIRIFSDTKESSNGVNNTINVSVDTNYYLLNSNIYSYMNYDITNISNIILPLSVTCNLVVDAQPQSSFTNSITINNNLIYPSSSNIYIGVESHNATRVTGTLPEYYLISYSLLMMSNLTYQGGGYVNDKSDSRYNASNFSPSINIYDNIIYKIGNYDIRCTIDFIIENNIKLSRSSNANYPVNYTVITKTLIPPPNFLTMTSNNNIISSIQPHGTLSLGSQIPESIKYDYLLYAPGKGLMNTMCINSIDTLKLNSNISCTNKNLIDINNISCQTINVNTLGLNNLTINDVTGRNKATFQTLIASNLSFTYASNEYLSMSNDNVHCKTRLSIGKSDTSREINNNCALRISIDSNIIPIENTFYNRYNGIVLTNDNTNLNPCLSIQSTTDIAYPYLGINNASSGYYTRLIKHSDDTIRYQITNDDTRNNNIARITHFKTKNYTPRILQHIKNYNVLSFGEQDSICIDCLSKNSIGINNTNESSKISIGVPYNSMTLDDIKDPANYFNYNINIPSNPYAINLFGNIRIANINTVPIFTGITQNNIITTAINGDPDNINTLKVNGNVYTTDLTSEKTIITSNLQSSNITLIGSGQLIGSNILNHFKITTKIIETEKIYTSNIYITDNLYININGVYKNLIQILRNSQILTNTNFVNDNNPGIPL
jgi:hypothetical protein